DGDVVLRLAGDRAGVTPRAGAEVDGHAPRVDLVLPGGEEGEVRGRHVPPRGDGLRVPPEVIQRALPDDAPLSRVASREVVMELRGGELVAGSGPRHLDSRDGSSGYGGEDGSDAEAHAVSDAPR